MELNNPPFKQKNTGTFSIGCAGLAFIIFILPIVLLFTFWAAGRFLVVADPTEPSSAVVALSGAENSSRLEEAAQIYLDGMAQWVILTETGEVYPETNALLTSIDKRELEQLGVPESAIIITEVIASSTWGESRVVRKLMLREGFTSCIVVTDPYHTRRTRIVFEDEFEPHNLGLIVRPTKGSWFRPSTWWLEELGWNVVISEYSKLAGYFFGLRQN